MAISKNIQSIIWDWNGTLLNDLELCLETINLLLHRRGLAPLSKERYLSVFAFPVREYYSELGFDFNKEPFEIPAREFIDIYNREVINCSLHDGVVPVLTELKKVGKQQVILSAMEQDILIQTLEHHQIISAFDEVSGLDNHYADSKLDNGKRLLKKLSLQPETTCLVGDTTHDFEVARELGCQCVLIANGHQSEQRLKATGSKVLHDIRELIA